MTLSCGLAAVDVPNLDRVERVPDTSHCVHLNAAEHVTRLLIDFFALAKPEPLSYHARTTGSHG